MRAEPGGSALHAQVNKMLEHPPPIALVMSLRREYFFPHNALENEQWPFPNFSVFDPVGKELKPNTPSFHSKHASILK